MRILILGGYGVFGGRTARLLSDLPDLELIIAGRSRAKAQEFCNAWTGTARATPFAVDRADAADAIAELHPDLVVDACGPFQAYGADPYHVARAAIAAHVHYVDLSDSAEFVNGITELDHDARAAGVFVLSGLSTCPALTHAVVAQAATSMIPEHITAGIAPSPRAGVGRNVISAILSYAGSPVAVLDQGNWTQRPALVNARAFTIAAPGRMPLPPTRFTLVEVPDLHALPDAFPSIRSFWFGAGTRPVFLHRMLGLAAWIRHRLRLPPLSPLTPMAHRTVSLFRMGEHRGGMFVDIRGTRDGIPQRLSWHLIAEGDDGPFIPSMGVAAIVRAIHAGKTPAAGARSAAGALTLVDYQPFFDARAIKTGWRQETPQQEPSAPYPAVLGDAFHDLPASLQSLHKPGARSVWAGAADVVRGPGPIPAILSRLFGFPAPGAAVPVSVTFTTDARGRETWMRSFDGKAMKSIQYAGTGKDRWHVVEAFGPLTFAMAVKVSDNRLDLIVRRWRCFGIPMPRAFIPAGDIHETVDAKGRFCFHVEIRVPLIGRIVRYRGWLEPQEGPDQVIETQTPPAS